MLRTGVNCILFLLPMTLRQVLVGWWRTIVDLNWIELSRGYPELSWSAAQVPVIGHYSTCVIYLMISKLPTWYIKFLQSQVLYVIISRDREPLHLPPIGRKCIRYMHVSEYHHDQVLLRNWIPFSGRICRVELYLSLSWCYPEFYPSSKLRSEVCIKSD